MGQTENNTEHVIPQTEERGGAILKPNEIFIKIWNLLAFEKYDEAMLVVENESRPLHALVVNTLPKVNDADREYAIAWVKNECLNMGVEIGTDSSRELMNSMYFNKIAKLQLWRFITSLDNEQADNFLNTVKHLQGELE